MCSRCSLVNWYHHGGEETYTEESHKGERLILLEIATVDFSLSLHWKTTWSLADIALNAHHIHYSWCCTLLAMLTRVTDSWCTVYTFSSLYVYFIAYLPYIRTYVFCMPYFPHTFKSFTACVAFHFCYSTSCNSALELPHVTTHAQFN